MMIMFIGLFLASLLGAFRVHATSYVVTFPNSLIPGIHLDVRVTVVKANGPVTIDALLQRVSDNSTVSTSTSVATAGLPKVIKLPVSDDLIKSQYKVVVYGRVGLNFRNESAIRFEDNSLLTFIQLDKSRYSGGQEVKYRAIFLRPNLMPYEGPVKLTIYDGHNNMIETKDFSSTRKGVVNGFLLLGQEPVFGTWSVTAEARILYKSYSKTFEVKDYILPKFEVTITVPAELKITVTSFQISVDARFTFETDVFGNCTIQIYNPDSTNRYVEYSKKIIGAVNFTVPMSEVKRKLLMDSKIKVRALVSDNATFLTMVNEKELYIVDDDSQITVTKLDNRDYYLPGMIYQTTISLKRQGRPIGFSGLLKVIPVVYEAQISTCLLNRPPTTWLNVWNTTKDEFMVSFNENGYGVLKFQTEHNYDKVHFKFSLDSSKDNLTVYAFSKNITRLLGLSSDKGYAQVGERVKVQADASENLDGYVQFEVFARGMLLQNESVLLRQTKTASFEVLLSADMVPRTYIVATYVTKDGVLLQDQIVLLVDGPPFKNNVSVAINGTTFKPRDGIQFTFKSSPESTVHVLIEDERNRLLGVENDIFSYQLTSNLWPVGHYSNRRKRTTTITEESEHGKDVIVLTDFNFSTRTPKSSLPISNPYNLPLKCITGITAGDFKFRLLASDGGIFPLTFGPTSHPGTLNPQEFIRSRFPETWLWEDYETGLNGRVDVTKVLPDSVTTWVTSVFAVDRKTGFGIPEEKYKIKVKRDFFLTMSTPPSLIIGEEFLLQITVFNNLGRRIQVQIQIDRSDDPWRPIPAATVVEHNQGHSTFAKISPLQAGVLKLIVRAKAGDFFNTYATDMIEHEIIVRHQGIRKTINHPNAVAADVNGNVIRKTISLGNHSYIIPGSQQIYIKITGDILTPTIDGLQELIVAPHGCGEQNMINFAPDVFVTNYLKFTGQLTKEMETKALSHIRTGYQNQLRFKRSDGSYSAFVDPYDPYGGTWLTAYVLKCFHHAKDLITIDGTVLDDATKWLLNRQNSDGSFIEQRPVRYVDHEFSKLRMSAFVVISLLEARTSQFPTLNNIISKGIGYLERALPQISDAYSLSITCYALAKYGSQYRQSCFTNLQTKMISQEGMVHWTENTRTPTTSEKRAPAKDIEATAYGLLTYIALGRYLDALPVVKWLASQRNPQGGFTTTQDTVITVQALTEYSFRLIRFNPNPTRLVQIEATGTGYEHFYSITSSNYNTSHRKEIPSSMSSINVMVSGNGLAVFDVVETFYVSKVQNHEDIGVTVTLLTESLNSLTIRPVLRWKGVSNSSLLMMEIEMPTGFGADVNFAKKQSVIRRHETNGQTFFLYFDSLASRQSVQVDIKMDRVDPVVGNQACHITVYDYYEPEKQSVTTYESGILKRANICNVCPLCSWCAESLLPTFGGK